ncbi:hypothetical protein BgiMline_007591, partial [Biomphalaria glabrata]
ISPFLKKIETTEKGKTVVRYEGFIHDLLQKIFNITGTQFIYAVRQDKRYGQQLENGSWDGLIGDVLNK